MPIVADHPPERSELIYRYHERLYRLALLLSAAPQAAAALVEAAFRGLPAGIPAEQAEPALVRALLAGYTPRRRWAFAPADLARTTLDSERAGALLRVLAVLTPAARLAVGLAYIGGSAPAEVAELLGDRARGLDAAATLAQFRIAAATAVGLVPADADPAQLARLDCWAEGQLSESEQLLVRRDLVAQPELRAIRDGLLAVRELLPRAIPALFAAAPPLALTAKLLQPAQPRRVPLAQLPARRAQLGLAVGILLLAAAIVIAPSWLAGRAARPANQAASTPADLIEAALHRFDRPPVQQGVLHELYRVERRDNPALLIERWYDYTSPHRLAIRVTAEGRERTPLLQISSDGRSLVQFRYDRAHSFGEQPLDVQLSQAEAQAVVPLLRGQPLAATFGRDGDEPGDLGPLFLAQARAAGPRLLGQTTLLGRPATLLTYTTSQPPPEPQPLEQPVRVVLTIDAQTYALLDVAVLAEGAAESTAQRPVRATRLELLAEAGDELFKLPGGSNVTSRIGMGSVRFPFISGSEQLPIDALAQRQPSTLLAPLQLPDAGMRGIAFKNGGPASDDIVLLYEGEFQNIILLSSFRPGANQELGAEQSAGAFRYRIIANRTFGGALAALVYRPEAPAEALGVILNDNLATAAERQAHMSALIESLVPIDAQSLPALRQTFQSPDSTAGKS